MVVSEELLLEEERDRDGVEVREAIVLSWGRGKLMALWGDETIGAVMKVNGQLRNMNP
jgi:hypothetical protein